MTKDVTDDSFKADVLDSKGLVVVDFWAQWCPPCRALTPLLEQLGEENKDKVQIVKLNVDENPKVSHEYGISGIPNVMFFRDGKLAESVMGLAPKPHYQQLIDKHSK